MQMPVFHWTDGSGERMRLIGQGKQYGDDAAMLVKLRDFSKPSDTKSETLNSMHTNLIIYK